MVHSSNSDKIQIQSPIKMEVKLLPGNLRNEALSLGVIGYILLFCLCWLFQTESCSPSCTCPLHDCHVNYKNLLSGEIVNQKKHDFAEKRYCYIYILLCT
jgi:hypothetical protein